MRLMDVSALMLEPQEGLSVKDVVDTAVKAESMGFPRIFRSDHLLPTSGRRGVPSAECWVTLSAIAAKTSRIRFGPLVSPIGFRHPTLLAKMAHDVYIYSGGRLILGMGAGWYTDEFASYGIPFPSTAERIRRLDEALGIVRRLVDGESLEYKGKYYSCTLEFHPKPSSRMWMIVGARNKLTVRVAARHADEWNFFAMGKRDYLQLRQTFERELKGRHIKVSMMTPFIISDDPSDLRRRVGDYGRRRGLGDDPDTVTARLRERGVVVGRPSEVLDQLAEWLDIGVQSFMFQYVDVSDEDLLESLVYTLKQDR
jgi:alkanesulfonate monooxygenase SsuD/methylene tetrahydromethanopterin reductase-like flavin-dependent oxidoreductase (luciferase family)